MTAFSLSLIGQECVGVVRYGVASVVCSVCVCVYVRACT